MKKAYLIIRAKWRLLFGFCPKCNSDAPEIDNCPICNNYRTEYDVTPKKLLKQIWYHKYKNTLNSIQMKQYIHIIGKKNIWCKLFGHRWHKFWNIDYSGKRCLRCNRELLDY